MPTGAVALTQELVRIPSVSGTEGEQRILARLGDLLWQAGFAVRSDHGVPQRFLLASTLTADTAPALLFVCHVDTVPVGDPSQWDRPPYSGEVAHDRVWGRGASDMKSGLAAAVVALLQAGPRSAPAAILLTTEEEVGCLGAAAATDALAGLRVGAIVVPESTDNCVVLGHRGALWLSLTSRGVAAHASTPHLGSNALLALARGLLDIEAALPRGAGESILGPTTVNVGTMSAGTAPNIVPEHASATVDIRFAGAEEPETVRAWLATNQPELEVRTALEIPRLLSSSDLAWVRSLPAPVAEPASANYFTDAAVLTSLFPDAPVAIWGPGQPDLAHVRDESVRVAAIEEAATLYDTALTAWLDTVSDSTKGSG